MPFKSISPINENYYEFSPKTKLYSNFFYIIPEDTFSKVENRNRVFLANLFFGDFKLLTVCSNKVYKFSKINFELRI